VRKAVNISLSFLFKSRLFFIRLLFMNNLYNKRVSPTTIVPQKGISYLEREREGKRESGGCAGHQADLFKVRLGLG
jgi:hypothetical protein